MKIAKKTLSVFLSFLMIFTTCSVALSGLTFSASAANAPKPDEVYKLVKEAAEKGVPLATSDTWIVTEDDGSLLAAAEAVYDYALGMGGKRVANNQNPASPYSSSDNAAVPTNITFYRSDPNASDTLADAVITDLKHEKGSDLSTNETNLVNYVLGQGRGSTVYGYKNARSTSNSWSQNKNKGDNVTTSSNVKYATTLKDVSKVTTINVDINKYLLNFDRETIANAKDEVVTSSTFTLNHNVGAYAEVTDFKAATCGNGTTTATSWIWHQIGGDSVKSGVVTDADTVPLFKKYVEFFTEDKLATTYEQMLEMSASELYAAYTAADGWYFGNSEVDGLSKESFFTSEIVDKYFAGVSTYVNELYKAYNVVAAKIAMDTLNIYIGNEYKDNDREGMLAIYTPAIAAYNNVKALDTAICKEVATKFYSKDFDTWMDECGTYLTTLKHYIDLLEIRVVYDNVIALMGDYEAAVQDPYAGSDVIETTVLVQAYETYLAYNSEMARLSGLFPENFAEVFTADDLARINAFADATALMVNERGAEANANSYYAKLVRYSVTEIALVSNADAMARYDEVEVIGSQIDDDFNAWKAQLKGDEALTAYAFSIYDNGVRVPVKDYIPGALDALRENLIARNNAQLMLIKEYAYLSTDANNKPTVTFSNFVLLSSAMEQLDNDLYNYVLDKGWLIEEEMQAIYDTQADLKAAVDAFKASGGLDNFESYHGHDENGVFTVRYAGDVKDENGNQIGQPHDVARTKGEDYVVTEQKVKDTIVKLDKFLTSDDFCDLLSLGSYEYDENGEKIESTFRPYDNLSQAISETLKDALFTDDMVNTIVGALFPMICDLIDQYLGDLGSLGLDMIGPSSDSASIGQLHLDGLVNNLSGDLDIYIDGNRGTIPFINVLESLGLNIYPSSLAKTLQSKYPAIAQDLTNAGKNWSYLVGEDGDTELTWEWGVTDADSFIRVVGDIFSAIGPLLQTLMVGKDFDQPLPANSVAASTTNIKYILSLGTVNAVVSGKLHINGLTLYKDLIGPIFELLGITNLPNLGTDASVHEIIAGIFNPILGFIDTLANAPIETVLSMLPNLMYALSMDKMQDLIDNIVITLNVKLNIDSMSGGLIANIGNSISAIRDAISNALNFSFDLALGKKNADGTVKDSPMLVLSELLQGLGIRNYTNVNTLIADVLTLVGMEGISLPLINVGDIITCAKVEDASSIRTGGTRKTLVADTPDVFYYLLKWVMQFLGSDSFSELVTSLAGDSLDPMILNILDAVSKKVGGNPEAALAALVELFNSQSYGTKDFDWFESDYNYANIRYENKESIVYLAGTNDWSPEKASAIVDNLDGIVDSILDLAGVDNEQSLNEMLSSALTGLFTNENMTSTVKELVNLGLTINDESIYGFIKTQLSFNLKAWSDAYLYLYPERAEYYEITDVVTPDDPDYKGIAGVNVTVDEDGVINWGFEDGDMRAFVDVFCKIGAEFAPIVAMLLNGESLTFFDDAIEIKGYDNYSISIGALFETLGIYSLSAEEFKEMCVSDGENAAFAQIVGDMLDWAEEILSMDNMLSYIIGLIPDFFYFFQSNGLSTVIHNLLMPIFVLIDTVRPLVDVDLNSIASVLISDILNDVSSALNNGEKISINLDINKILDVVFGTYAGETDPNYVSYNIDLGHITAETLINVIDNFLGTELMDSQLVTVGLNALCAGVITAGNTGMRHSMMQAGDAFTILISSLLEALQYETTKTDENGKAITNGQIICSFLDTVLTNKLPENMTVLDIYNAAMTVISGVEVKYDFIKWGYMWNVGTTTVSADKDTKTIVYLGYNNDWTEDAAKTVDASLESLVDLIMNSALGEDSDIMTLLNGVLADNVYSDEILNTVIELLVNAISALDETLRNTVDAVVDTNIAGWFEMCTFNEETGKYECTKDWGFKEDMTDAEKKDIFLNGVSDVLAPAEKLLSWLFFGTSFALFTGTDKDENGAYTYNDIITINGGEGYNYGIVPILEALGCDDLKNGAAYANGDGTYNVGQAVTDIFNSVLDRVEAITSSDNMVNEVLLLIPNLIYFINADGIKTSVNNLLAPANAVIEALAPVVGDVSIGGMLEDTIGFDISDLTMETILTLVMDKTDIVFNEQMYMVLRYLYVGEFEQFTSANGRYAYRLSFVNEDGTEDTVSRYDFLTILLSFALDFVNLNKEFLVGVGLDEATYDAIVKILGGVTFSYADPNWAYMYEGEDALAQLITNGLPERTEENSVVYLQYANDWSDATASALEANLAQLIDAIFAMAGQQDSTLGTIIANAVSDNLYSAEVLNSIVKAIADLVNGLDEDMANIVNMAGSVLGADVKALTEVNFAEGSITNEEQFIAALKEVIKPVDRVFAWLLLAKDYQFLSGTTNDNLITVAGGQGYAQGLAPILEALGCENLKAAADLANGTEAVAYIVETLLDRVDTICGGTSGATINEMLDLIVNVIYFVSADGIKASVNNLLAPVTAVLEALKPVGLEVDLSTLIKDFDITNIGWDVIFDLLDSNNIVLTDSAKQLIKTFYIGSVSEKTSAASGKQYFTMQLDSAEARRDMITIVLSVALETLENDANSETFAKLFGEETYNTIVKLLAGNTGSFTYENPNWAYMYDGEDALAQLIANNLPARTGTNSIVYTQYTNNWNEATASYLNDNLSLIIESIVEATQGSTIGTLLEAAIAGGLYKDAILDQLLTTVVKLLAGLDQALVKSVGAVLDVDIDTWFDWCEITRDEDGNVTDVVCTKDWGIDAKATNAEKKDAFVAAFTEALKPANRVIAWLFFGQNYTFLNDATGEDLITITGGEGYAYGIVPIFEALGREMKPASAYAKDGAYDCSAALGDVLTAFCDTLTAMCENGITLDVMIDILTNLIYFINADGVKTSVNNLLQPVYFLLETLSPLVGEVNLDELIGFPLSDLTFDAVFDIVADQVGLHFTPVTQEFVKTFYMGKVVEFTSANGEQAFRMTYSDTETRREMLTCILSFVLDNIKYDQNEAILSKWFGADIYKTIVNVLGIREAKPMQNFSWYNTEYANTDKTFSAINTSERYTGTYNDKWTKERAQYVANNLPVLIGNILCLIGLEDNGVKLDNLEAVINDLVSNNLYTQANIDAILDALKGALSQLDALEPYGTYVFEVLKTAIDFDVHAWDDMTITVEDGDRASFEAALAQIVAPAAPLLKLLLTGEDISLFLNIDGGNAVTIPGSEGYAYGIIPLLEALGCEGIKTPAEFKAILDTDANAAFIAVADPLFDRLDAIFANPLDEILDMLPAVIYFINSNGLDTCVKNLINSVDTVLAALEPALGESDLMSLLGVDLTQYNFEWIVDTLLTSVEESTGFELAPIVINAIAEFTVGKVVSYKSVNGETYYTMEYASELDKADMLTIVLRMVVDFITIDENIEKIEELLKDYIPNEDNYKSVCSMIESLQKAAKDDPGMGNALYVLYYIFVGLNESAEKIDDLYHDVNNSWQFILKMLETSNDPMLKNYGTTIKTVLNKYFDGIFDEGGIAPDGAMTFIQKLKAFFQKIADFFRKLFGITK